MKKGDKVRVIHGHVFYGDGVGTIKKVTISGGIWFLVDFGDNLECWYRKENLEKWKLETS